MRRVEIGGEAIALLFWAFGVLIFGFLGISMRNTSSSDGGAGGVVSRSARSSFRAISSYLRIVSSGASTVARSAVSVASSIVDRENDSSHDQVLWAGFDKLEGEGDDDTRRILLLGYRSGFQVWDVEEVDNVRDLVSKYDGPVSFMQVVPKLLKSKRSEDKFADSRPLLVVCADSSSSGGSDTRDGLAIRNGTIPNNHDPGNGGFLPTIVRFYSFKSQSYVHMLKFRSAIYAVRCSSRIVAVSQAAQIHCFDAATLEREFTILTNPIIPGSGGVGYGPLAVGPRWLAYSGSPVAVSNTGRVSPQHLTPSTTSPGFPSNGSLVVHYAKESSKQLAAGIVTLGDMGYKKLSRYCSEILPDSYNSLPSGIPGWKGNGTVNGHLPDADSIGMVIVRDIVSKGVISQFRAHKSPISALCFDLSGTLLVTASVLGHNINVFKIMPGFAESSSVSDAGASSVHLYRLQRGFTNAVIQDISFSDDSNWIMISSSRGTSHLFAINPSGGLVNLHPVNADFASQNSGPGVMTTVVQWPPSINSEMPSQQGFCTPGPPVTLSVVCRIRNGSNGWMGTVSGAAAAATGRSSPLSGAIASSFCSCKGNNSLYASNGSLSTKYSLLVFSPSGCMIQYALQRSAGHDSLINGLTTGYEAALETEGRLQVEAVQKWTICQKHTRREREDNIDIYGENGTSNFRKIYPEEVKTENCTHPAAREATARGKLFPEGKHHLYISEAELQMHQAQTPLWAKPGLCFQSMEMAGVKKDGDCTSGGEIEIEQISTHMIEARPKNLVPVFYYVQTPKFQQPRAPSVDTDGNGQLLHRMSGLSEKGQLSSRSSSCSLESMIDRGAEFTPPHGQQVTAEANGYVNNNDSHRTRSQLNIVNNIESLRAEAQLNFVNNKSKGLKMENHYEDQDDEFD